MYVKGVVNGRKYSQPVDFDVMGGFVFDGVIYCPGSYDQKSGFSICLYIQAFCCINTGKPSFTGIQKVVRF